MTGRGSKNPTLLRAEERYGRHSLMELGFEVTRSVLWSLIYRILQHTITIRSRKTLQEQKEGTEVRMRSRKPWTLIPGSYRICYLSHFRSPAFWPNSFGDYTGFRLLPDRQRCLKALHKPFPRICGAVCNKASAGAVDGCIIGRRH
jgi:hypothetical protein